MEIVLEVDSKMLEILNRISNVEDGAVVIFVNDANYVEFIVDYYLGKVRVQRVDVDGLTVDEVKEHYTCPQCGAPHVSNFYVYKLN